MTYRDILTLMALAIKVVLWIGLLVVSYVRTVAAQVEVLSGFRRAEHRQMYRVLLGSALAILALWPNLIQLPILVAILVLSGWQTALLCIAIILAFPFAIHTIARMHAAEILKEVEKVPATHI